jgi:Protein of unknown function (DUF3768)
LAATVDIAERVAAFDSFTKDNDPHRERDFGSFDYGGNRIFWKIDYYDRASFGTGHDIGSEDPSGLPHDANQGYVAARRLPDFILQDKDIWPRLCQARERR